MFFDNLKFDKIKWDKLKFDFDFDGNFSDALYQKIPVDARKKIEAFVWDNAIAQIRKYLGAKHCKFKCSDGQEFCYLDIGDKSKDVFLYIHGFGDTKESAYSIAKALSNRFRVIIPDVPGFGESKKREDMTYDLENYSRWMKEFIESNFEGPVNAMGNSLGGGIILQMAVEKPDLFSSIALLDAAGVIPLHTESVYDEFNRGENIFSVNDLKDFEKFISRVVVEIPFTPSPLKFHMCNTFVNNKEWYHKIIDDIGHGIGANRDKQTNIDQALNNQISQIKIPTLIIWGEGDTLFPLEVAAILHTKITTSQLVVFENVGHIPQLEVPKKVVKRYVKFLDSLQL